MDLSVFNSLPEDEALAQMLGCCHCFRWAARMVAGRPYADLESLLQAAEDSWARVGEADYLEAFSAHARIGDIEKLRNRFSRAHAEQGQVLAASEEVLQQLFKLNQEYEKKHGFIFIVCATGKSASEMLRILQLRLPLSRDQELENAAQEQAKITAIRLRALFAPARVRIHEGAA